MLVANLAKKHNVPIDFARSRWQIACRSSSDYSRRRYIFENLIYESKNTANDMMTAMNPTIGQASIYEGTGWREQYRLSIRQAMISGGSEITPEMKTDFHKAVAIVKNHVSPTYDQIKDAMQILREEMGLNEGIFDPYKYHQDDYFMVSTPAIAVACIALNYGIIRGIVSAVPDIDDLGTLAIAVGVSFALCLANFYLIKSFVKDLMVQSYNDLRAWSVKWYTKIFHTEPSADRYTGLHENYSWENDLRVAIRKAKAEDGNRLPPDFEKKIKELANSLPDNPIHSPDEMQQALRIMAEELNLNPFDIGVVDASTKEKFFASMHLALTGIHTAFLFRVIYLLGTSETISAPIVGLFFVYGYIVLHHWNRFQTEDWMIISLQGIFKSIKKWYQKCGDKVKAFIKKITGGREIDESFFDDGTRLHENSGWQDEFRRIAINVMRRSAPEGARATVEQEINVEAPSILSKAKACPVTATVSQIMEGRGILEDVLATYNVNESFEYITMWSLLKLTYYATKDLIMTGQPITNPLVFAVYTGIFATLLTGGATFAFSQVAGYVVDTARDFVEWIAGLRGGKQSGNDVKATDDKEAIDDKDVKVTHF